MRWSTSRVKNAVNLNRLNVKKAPFPCLGHILICKSAISFACERHVESRKRLAFQRRFLSDNSFVSRTGRRVRVRQRFTASMAVTIT